MPSTRRNRTRALLKASSAPYIASASASSSPLRPGSEESDDISIIDVTNHKVVSWQDLRRRQSDDGTSSELDDPMDYKFQVGDFDNIKPCHLVVFFIFTNSKAPY
jgi:hypothetical protein